MNRKEDPLAEYSTEQAMNRMEDPLAKYSTEQAMNRMEDPLAEAVAKSKESKAQRKENLLVRL